MISSNKCDWQAQWLLKRTHRRFGLEILAIMYSLPYSLLMWRYDYKLLRYSLPNIVLYSMIYFAAAMGILCFKSSDMLLNIIFAVAWFAIIILIIWTIYAGWTKPVLNFMDWILTVRNLDCYRQYMTWISKNLFRRKKQEIDVEKQTSGWACKSRRRDGLAFYIGLHKFNV